ncbi:MAG: Gfo/Idh/MocA family oxidoreductase [Defluviitaleaceae bacterium]|nr:Gfo/Idh/MocA family oxidoreductase [Defluviitaleaceae bacterium]
MKPIKLGIVGLGLAWERLHAPALAQLRDKFEIVAVCDKDLEKARNVVQFMGHSPENAFDNLQEMLERDDIEAVLSLVPISANFETAATIMRYRKHLLAEKPFASSPQAARRLIKMRDLSGTTVMVAENVRYEEQNILIKEAITNGEIGEPAFFIDTHIVDYMQDSERGGFGQTNWRQHPLYEGGVLLDSGVHHMARLRYFFGDITDISAHGRPPTHDFAPYSCMNALLRFENIAGHYSFYTESSESQAPFVGLRIFGTQGEIFLENSNCGFVNISYKDGREAVAMPYTPGVGYRREIENFYAAIREGAPIKSTPEKAVGDIEAVFALLESAKKGRTVDSSALESDAPEQVVQAYMFPKVSMYPGARV